jgi:hypothetical protein
MSYEIPPARFIPSTKWSTSPASETGTLSMESPMRSLWQTIEDGASPYASPEVWAAALPISELPELPRRSKKYFAQPFLGLCLVGSVSTLCVSLTRELASENDNSQFVKKLHYIVCACAAMAGTSTAYIIFGKAGEVRRSDSTCYPIPKEVAVRLMQKQPLDGLGNIVCSADGRSYCVRCLLWRPAQQRYMRSHHCQICQRCHMDFDHHCAVFGRCIVGGNLIPFRTLFFTFFLGFGGTWCAFFSASK